MFSAFSSFGLTAVFAWFISEHMVFYKHQGGKWLGDIIDDLSKRITGAAAYGWVKIAVGKLRAALAWSPWVVRRTSVLLGQVIATFSRSPVATGRTETREAAPEPPIQLGLGNEEQVSGGAGNRPSNASFVVSPIQETETETLTPLAKFRNLARKARLVDKMMETASQKQPEAFPGPRSSQATGLVGKLQKMIPTHSIPAHTALVRHMQVSLQLQGGSTISIDAPPVLAGRKVLGYLQLGSYFSHFPRCGMCTSC